MEKITENMNFHDVIIYRNYPKSREVIRTGFLTLCRIKRILHNYYRTSSINAPDPFLPRYSTISSAFTRTFSYSLTCIL